MGIVPTYSKEVHLPKRKAPPGAAEPPFLVAVAEGAESPAATARGLHARHHMAVVKTVLDRITFWLGLVNSPPI